MGLWTAGISNRVRPGSVRGTVHKGGDDCPPTCCWSCCATPAKRPSSPPMYCCCCPCCCSAAAAAMRAARKASIKLLLSKPPAGRWLLLPTSSIGLWHSSSKHVARNGCRHDHDAAPPFTTSRLHFAPPVYCMAMSGGVCSARTASTERAASKAEQGST